jgi:hypothetical protein
MISKERPAQTQTSSSKISPKPQMRQCWAADKEDRPKKTETGEKQKLTSFKNLKETLKSDDREDSTNSSQTSSMTSSWCSWFIPTEENPEENMIER